MEKKIDDKKLKSTCSGSFRAIWWELPWSRRL